MSASRSTEDRSERRRRTQRELRSIVEALAAAGPFIDYHGGDQCCHTCTAAFSFTSDDPARHDETCVWRRAVEFVQTHTDKPAATSTNAPRSIP